MTTFGKEMYHLNCVDSTNNFAANLISDQICQSGAVILADVQTAGKGQMGNTWESAESKNLLCSLVWKPDNLSVDDQFKLSWMISLALHKLLLRFGIDAQVKWPNDIYVGSQKIAGMLIENQLEGSRISWVIAGIGLNVNQQQFDSATAVSMHHFLGIDVQVKTVLSELLDLMNGYVNNWESLNTQFKAEVEEILFQKGMEANYRDEHGEFVGVIQGITNEGKLAVKVMDELRTYNLKEIQFC